MSYPQQPYGYPSPLDAPLHPSPPPRVSRAKAIIVLAGAVVLLAAGGLLLLLTQDPGTPVVAASPSWSSVFGANPTLTSAPNDANGLRACHELANVNGSQDQYDAATMEEIGKIFVISADSSLRLHGQLLIDRAKLAKAGKGKGDELSLIADMVTTATDLGTYCLQHGYVKP